QATRYMEPHRAREGVLAHCLRLTRMARDFRSFTFSVAIAMGAVPQAAWLDQAIPYTEYQVRGLIRSLALCSNSTPTAEVSIFCTPSGLTLLLGPIAMDTSQVG